MAENGHKVPKDKLQFCQDTVHYLGHDLSQEGKTLCDRQKAIQAYRRPVTKRQLGGFLV